MDTRETAIIKTRSAVRSNYRQNGDWLVLFFSRDGLQLYIGPRSKYDSSRSTFDNTSNSAVKLPNPELFHLLSLKGTVAGFKEIHDEKLFGGINGLLDYLHWDEELRKTCEREGDGFMVENQPVTIDRINQVKEKFNIQTVEHSVKNRRNNKMAKEYTYQDTVKAMGDEAAFLIQNGRMPWQQAMRQAVTTPQHEGIPFGITIERPRDGATNMRYQGANTPTAIILASMMMFKDNNRDPRFYTFDSAKKADCHIKQGSKGRLVINSFKADKDKDGNLLPFAEQRYVNRSQWIFPAKSVSPNIPVLDEAGNPVKTVLTDKDGHPVIDKNGEEVLRNVYTDGTLPAYDNAKKISPEQTLQLAKEIFAKGVAEHGIIVKDDIAADKRPYYTGTANVIHLKPKESYENETQYYTVALNQLAYAEVLLKNRDTFTKLKEAATIENTPEAKAKYDNYKALQHFKAEVIGTNLSMDLGLPLDSTSRADYRDNLAAQFTKKPFDFIRASQEANVITYELKGRAKELMSEIFKSDKEGPSYYSSLKEKSAELKNKQLEDFGKEKFENYQKAFNDVYETGKKIFKSGQQSNAQLRYQQFIFSKAFQYGLSAMRPDNREGWEKADKAFVIQYAKEHELSPTALKDAADTIKEISPFTKIDTKYQVFVADILNSKEFSQLRNAAAAEKAPEAKTK